MNIDLVIFAQNALIYMEDTFFRDKVVEKNQIFHVKMNIKMIKQKHLSILDNGF